MKLRRWLRVPISIGAMAAIALAIAVLSIDLSAPPLPSAALAPLPPPQCTRTAPMLVAPIFPEADAGDAAWRDLATTLDALEPGGARGDVVLGHMVTLPILKFFKRTADGQWFFDQEALAAHLQPITQIPRPAVVYLMTDHFTPDSELVRELARDARNLMAKQNGQPPVSRYFGSIVQPFTLSTDETLPINRLRFAGLRSVTIALQQLDLQYPGRIRAVTLGGEVHHLFDGLQENTGKFAEAEYTDYSPTSIAEFRTWLQGRHKSLAELNRAYGTRFASWEQVQPPSIDIRHAPVQGFWQHMDANAAGTLPVYGWIDVDAGVRAVHVEVDGRPVGQAALGINRLDVYQARADIRNPNTGFRFDLDLRTQAPGVHRIRITAEMNDGKRLQLASRSYARMSATQTLPSTSWRQRLRDWLHPETVLPAFSADKSWLDSPRDMQDVYVNPYAAEWQTFREDQVRAHMVKLFDVALSTGFDPTRLYSHQLLPALNGGWNDMTFAAGRSFEDVPYQTGITLYGGLTVGTLPIAVARGKPYGVPEMNPMLSKDPSEPDRALELAYTHCAQFVSPMYMTLANRPHDSQAQEGVFAIEKNSARAESRNFYAAIERFVRK